MDIDGITSELSIEDLIILACRGGWPDSLKVKNEKAKLLIAKDYVNKVCDDDISRIDNIKRNPELTRLILRSYARNLCTLAKKSAILNDVNAEMSVVSQVTFDDYVDALKRLYVLEDIDAWCPAIRSASAIRVGKKRCFIDPSIAIAAMGASPKILELDLKTFGFLFETLCVRDLRVFADALNGDVYHYRDKDGQECDAVIHLRNGQYGLVEIKLGGDKLIEEGASSLKSMEMKLDTDKMNAPSFLMVLTGTGDYAYRRQDGVYVIPIGCLKN